jgi:group I intron endonuclease
MIGIYKITNPNGKIYIGQSTDIEKRFIKYKYLDCKSQTILYRSFNKYGFEVHNFEVILECNIEELNDKERHYQDLYQCLGKNGLNCKLTKSKDKSGLLSENTKEKIKQSLIGRKRNPEIGVKTGNALRGRKLSEEVKLKLSKNNSRWNLGKNLSEETKLKISENNKMKRSIINSITGVIYSSIKEASEKENISYDKLRKYMRSSNNNNFKYI